MAADFADRDSVSEDENDYDIIIIGAGLAGLTCAYNILKKRVGLRVLIIEANNEIGGRILPNNFSYTYHANILQRNITELMNTLKVQIDQGNDSRTEKRILYTKEKALKVLPKFYGAEVYNFVQTIEEIASYCSFSNYTEDDAKRLAETSVEQLLREMVYFPYARSLCRAYICSTCVMRNLNDISALWFLVMLNGASGFLNRLRIMMGDDNQYFAHGGMIKVTQELLKNILRQHGEIIYVDPVNQISMNDNQAYVSTAKKRYRCELVVLAIPPSIQNQITIEPTLNSTNTGTLYTAAENVFFNVIYKKPFPDNSSVKDIITTWDSDNNLNMIYNTTHGNMEKIALAGFLAEANLLHTHKKGLFDTLNDCYKSTQASKYLHYNEYNQSLINESEKTGCPMSVLRPTSVHNFNNSTGKSYESVQIFNGGSIKINWFLSKISRDGITETKLPFGPPNAIIDIINELIFFASSEYATNWPGTMDGAVQAGENTAFEVLLRIRPQALNFLEMCKFGGKDLIKRSDGPISSKICVLQYLGVLLNVAIFLSFLKTAYD